MKKLLAIDGGGIRGLIPALVLAEIERCLGHPIAQSVDLLAGTSTGGLLSLGLTRDNGHGQPLYSADRIAQLYVDRGGEIFSRSFWRGVSSIGGLADEKYSHEALVNVLREYFGDEPLSAALKPVLISAYDLENRQPFFFKSWRPETRSVLMRQAAHATAAAPTYFEPALIPVGSQRLALVDGGVFLQNPAMSAYAEARRLFPDEREFLIISLGTGELTRPILYQEAKDWGLVEWALPLLGVVFDGVSDAVDYQLRQILGERFFRFQTRLDIASDDMDDASRRNLEALKHEATQLIQAQRADLDRVCGLLQRNVA